MSSDLWAVMVAKALEMDEGVIPDCGEPWFRKSFVANILGYQDIKRFQSLVNRLGVPTHPFHNQFIRFSSLSEVSIDESAADSGGVSDSVPGQGPDAADQSARTPASRRRGRSKKR